MESPFKNIELKHWPDFLLAISGAAFLASLVALYSDVQIAKYLSIFFFGFVLFGIGGKIAHYKYRDPNIGGNVNAWFSGWKHSLLADSFALFGVILIVLSIACFIKVNA